MMSIDPTGKVFLDDEKFFLLLFLLSLPLENWSCFAYQIIIWDKLTGRYVLYN